MAQMTSFPCLLDPRLKLMADLAPPTTVALIGGDVERRREQALTLAEHVVGDETGRVARNVHPDVVTLREDDAVDVATIRERMGMLGFRPFEARCSVFILEAAGRLEPAASNAMLKTLEDGGAYLLVILEVDSRDELVETVASRSYFVPFGFLPREVEPASNFFLSMMRAGTLHTIDELERETLEEALIESQKALMVMCERGMVDVEWALTLNAAQVFLMVKLLVRALRDFDRQLNRDLLLSALGVGMRKEVLGADSI